MPSEAFMMGKKVSQQNNTLLCSASPSRPFHWLQSWDDVLLPVSVSFLSGEEARCILKQSVPCTASSSYPWSLGFLCPPAVPGFPWCLFYYTMVKLFIAQSSLGETDPGFLKTDVVWVHELLPGSLTLLGFTKESVHQISSCWQPHLKPSFL